MANVYIPLPPETFIPAASNGAAFTVVDGTNFPVSALAFSTGVVETAYTSFVARNYASGNLSLDLLWYANSASTSGDVVWGAAIAAITPNTDSQDIETKAFATATTVTDTHLGTTAQRLHKCTITISNLDSLADGDEVYLKLTRETSGNTLTGDANIVFAELSYLST